MNIYICRRKDEVGWDEFDSFVCLANSPKEAKQLAQEAANMGEWHPEPDAFLSGSCKKIPLDSGKPRILLGSFNAG